METVNLFGAGFIGGWYARTYPKETEIVGKDRVLGRFPNSLYMISTVHNYHPIDSNPYIDIETNLNVFIQHLSAHKAYWEDCDGVFNLVSTWFVYGNTELPAKEFSPCYPTGFYSITARAREQLLMSYCETFGLKWRILRLGNVIGVGDKKISRRKNALQFMIQELAQGRDIDYLYKGGTVRDYIDVRDCVRAIHLVLEKGKLNEIYNISNGKGYNVNDLVKIAWRESGYKSKITEIEVPEFHRTVQTPRMYMDTKKLKSLGYVQQHDIPQSVRELVHHYNEQDQNS